MRCQNCGTENDPESQFCINCGYPLSEEKKKSNSNGKFPLFIGGGIILILVLLWFLLIQPRGGFEWIKQLFGFNGQKTMALPTKQITSTTESLVPPDCTTIGQTWTSPKDGMELVCVPAGEFKMGADSGNTLALYKNLEFPQRVIYLDAYWMDEMEVSNKQFEKFVLSTGYETTAESLHNGMVMNISTNQWENDPRANWRNWRGITNPSAESDHPVTQVSWDDANAYCAWAGRSLPSEAQWEKAARGTDGYSYPFEYGTSDYVFCMNANFSDKSLGSIKSKMACNDHYQFTAPVTQIIYITSYVDPASQHTGPYGTRNMLGNVNEWILDDFDAKYYSKMPYSNPVNITHSQKKGLRGGSWGSMPEQVRYTARNYDLQNSAYDTLGFRCSSPLKVVTETTQ
jgi:formylglycine-generating enzyme required for sulfatase activity